MFNVKSGCSNHLKAAFRKKEAVKDAVGKAALLIQWQGEHSKRYPNPPGFAGLCVVRLRNKCTLKGGLMAP